MADRPDLIGLEGMKRLEGRNIKELSLEEALEIKDLLDAGASAYLPVGALNGPTTTRRIYLNMLSELNAHIENIYRKWAAPDEVEGLHAAIWGPAPNKRGRIKFTDRMKAEAKARRDEQKAASAKAFDLSFTINTYEGEEYFVNDRGDVLRMDGTWVGRFDGSKIVAMPEPANIAGAKMRALSPMTAPPPRWHFNQQHAAALEGLVRDNVLPADILDELRGAGASDEDILKAVEELGLSRPVRKGGRRTRRNSRKRKSSRKKRV